MRLLECVPNISEGRDQEKIASIAEEVKKHKGVKLLDFSSDKDHHRSVFTFVGEPEAIKDAAFSLAMAGFMRTSEGLAGRGFFLGSAARRPAARDRAAKTQTAATDERCVRIWTLLESFPRALQDARQDDAGLALILPLAVLVAGLAELAALQEKELGDALVGIDLGGQGRGVADLDGQYPLPLGLERGDVDDDAATRVGALAQADGEHVAGDAEVLDGARQGEGVRRDDAVGALVVHEGLGVEALGVHHPGQRVGEYLELVGDADVVAVGGQPVGDLPVPV